jgi:hypothetical protein
MGNKPREIPTATEMQGEYAERKLMLFIVVHVKFTL